MPKKGTGRQGGTFGLYSGSRDKLIGEIRKVLDLSRLAKAKLDRNPIWVFPERRLRSRLAHAMQLDVLFQPIGWHVPKENGLGGYKPNTLWRTGPSWAYYRARKVRSLLYPVVTIGYDANIVHDLERLAINIWHMHPRCFDGLVRRIYARCAFSAKAERTRKSPEATARWRPLTVNPLVFERVMWSNYNHKVGGYTSELCRLRLSYSLGTAVYADAKLVRDSDRRSLYPEGYRGVFKLLMAKEP